MEDYIPLSTDIGRTVMEVLSDRGVMELDTPCAGKGRCGKCLIKTSGALSPPTEREAELIGGSVSQGWRLACLARVEGPFGYEINNSTAGAQIQTDWSADQVFADTGARGYAMAADIGTTTVAVYAIDTASGAILDSRSFVNPQKPHGADVISRLAYAIEGGADILKQELWDELNRVCKELFGGKPRYAVICGNTAMEHFITGLDSTGIAKLPFTPASLFGGEYETDFCSHTYIAPCVAAYVGGDVTAGAVAADVDRSEELTLYIDIGTNGEIVLADAERALCCAAAAGPAFEGANIECGSIARRGAVSRVWYDGTLKYETIGDAPPTGICGSGLIDCVAALLEAGLLDETGKLETHRYELCPDVYISQSDIRALQLAKAAIAAGIGTLLDEMKYRARDIKKVIIAGGFGSHIDPDHACDIGLIPDGLRDSIEFLGNCAGLGAVNCALSREQRKRTEEFAQRLEYIELSGHKKFNQLYIEEMFFE